MHHRPVGIATLASGHTVAGLGAGASSNPNAGYVMGYGPAGLDKAPSTSDVADSATAATCNPDQSYGDIRNITAIAPTTVSDDLTKGAAGMLVNNFYLPATTASRMGTPDQGSGLSWWAAQPDITDLARSPNAGSVGVSNNVT